MAAVRCISCGYDLSGQTEGYHAGVRCPECGEGDAARRPPPVPGVWGPVVLCLVGIVCWWLPFVMLLATRPSWVTNGEAVWGPVLIGIAMACFIEARRRSATGTKVWIGIVVSWIGILMSAGLAGAVFWKYVTV